jgi:hypothetical protein
MTIDYMIYVWNEKPSKINLIPSKENEYWQAHIKEAHKIPDIGQLVVSGGETIMTEENTFRVFEIINSISPCLSYLVSKNIGKTTQGTTPTGEEGLVKVLAYLEK